jgi:hypothetical protein
MATTDVASPSNATTATWQIREAIEAALRESRQLASVGAWVVLVRGSLATWRDQLQSRDRRLERHQAAEQQREDAMKERRRRELEHKKEGMMERIRLMKERALADAARSQDNVAMNQDHRLPAAPPPGTSPLSPPLEKETPRSELQLPRLKLSSRADDVNGGTDGKQRSKANSHSVEGSAAKDFSVMEAVEEATINQSAAKVKLPAIAFVLVCRRRVVLLTPVVWAQSDDQAGQSAPLACAFAIVGGGVSALATRRDASSLTDGRHVAAGTAFASHVATA